LTRIALATACAAALMAGSAQAATYVDWGDPGPDGAFTGTFGNTDITGDADGNFTDVFDFTLPTGISSFTVSSTFSDDASNDVNFDSITFNGTDFQIGTTGQNEFRFLNDVDLQAGGMQHLIVSGFTGGNGSYSGVISFTPSAGAVPEPAAWALMIVGFAGAGAALRRRKVALA
jgi:hypothetical protein